jgi:hypothetical protein
MKIAPMPTIKPTPPHLYIISTLLATTNIYKSNYLLYKTNTLNLNIKKKNNIKQTFL